MEQTWLVVAVILGSGNDAGISEAQIAACYGLTIAVPQRGMRRHSAIASPEIGAKRLTTKPLFTPWPLKAVATAAFR